jgi:hypothetical protein
VMVSPWSSVATIIEYEGLYLISNFIFFPFLR